jgi:hypothetical protein
MLGRAATNAYSWWWASHVRTKQSKWLEQSLQGMYVFYNTTIPSCISKVVNCNALSLISKKLNKCSIFFAISFILIHRLINKILSFVINFYHFLMIHPHYRI